MNEHWQRSKNIRLLIVSAYPFPYVGAVWRRIEYFSRFLGKIFSVYVIGALTPSYIIKKMRGRLQHAKHTIYDYASTNFSILNILPYIDFPTPLSAIINMLFSLIMILVFFCLRPMITIISVPESEIVLGTYIGARLVKSKIVVDFRDPDEDLKIKFSKGLTRWIYKVLKHANSYVYKRSDLIIAVTVELAKHISMNYDVLRPGVVPNGADLEVFKPITTCEKLEIRRKFIKLSESDICIVYSGGPGAYYDLNQIVLAIWKYNQLVKENALDVRPRIKLVIVGKGKKLKKHIEFASKLGLRDYVIYLGYYDKAEDVARIIASCDIGLIPRTADPLLDYSIPVKLYEYIACGIPVIVTARKGSALVNFIHEYGIGYVCEYLDIDCLVQTFQKIEDRNTLEKLRFNTLKIRTIVDRRRGALKLLKMLYTLIKSQGS